MYGVTRVMTNGRLSQPIPASGGSARSLSLLEVHTQQVVAPCLHRVRFPLPLVDTEVRASTCTCHLLGIVCTASSVAPTLPQIGHYGNVCQRCTWQAATRFSTVEHFGIRCCAAPGAGIARTSIRRRPKGFARPNGSDYSTPTQLPKGGSGRQPHTAEAPKGGYGAREQKKKMLLTGASPNYFWAVLPR